MHGAVPSREIRKPSREDLQHAIELGRRLYEVAPPFSITGVPKRFVELTAAGHNDVVFASEQELEQAVREFLETLESD